MSYVTVEYEKLQQLEREMDHRSTRLLVAEAQLEYARQHLKEERPMTTRYHIFAWNKAAPWGGMHDKMEVSYQEPDRAKAIARRLDFDTWHIVAVQEGELSIIWTKELDDIEQALDL